MDALLQDVRYAVRGLVRSPGFTAAALLTLAIGTGANATVFGFVNALLLRPAPAVTDPRTLYSVFTSDFSSGPYGASSYPDYLTMRERAASFSALGAYGIVPAVLRDARTTERVSAMQVSPEVFEILGLRAAHGRLLLARDFAADAAPVVVISHHLWQRMFGSDRAVLGRTAALNGQAFTIVGVAPRRFDGLHLGAPVDVWTPLLRRAGDPAERGQRSLSVVGRLRAGMDLAAAQAELDIIAADLARAYPATNMGTLASPDRPRPIVVTRHSRMHPQFRGMVAMLGGVLMSAVGLVLLVACANVAGLLLSRGAARARELTTRLALGASRVRLVRQLVTESILLGLCGGALGILFALWTSDVLPSFFPPAQARLLDAGVDGRVLAFVAVLSVAAGTVFGLVPAWRVLRGMTGRPDLDGSRATAARAGFVRGGLVLAQVAITFVLLVACGLFVRTLSNALSADLGFTTRRAVLANVEIPPTDLDQPEGEAYLDDLLARVRALPGVEEASLARHLSLGGASRRVFAIDGYHPRPGEDMELPINVVEHGFFQTMGMPLVAGRTFDARDGAAGRRVVVVNDVLAQRYFGGRAVGRRIREGRGAELEVIGVVRGGHYRSVQEPPAPMVYYPLRQAYAPRLTLVVRTSGEPAAMADTVRSAAQGVNRSVALFRVTTLEAHLEEALGAERLTAALVTTAGAMSLALAVVGVYGVIAYGVACRQKEIGVRMALGARPLDVVRLVVRQGIGVAACGIGLGVVAALASTRVLGAMLFGVEPWDLPTFAAAGTLLALVAAAAAWMPARRAARVDPVAALRED
jgi:putative ABC transport system permease protein